MSTPSPMQIASAYINVDTKRVEAGLTTKPCVTDQEILDYIYADFIEAHPRWKGAAQISTELVADVGAYVGSRRLANSWIDCLIEIVKAHAPRTEPLQATIIKDKLWFVDGKRFGGRNTSMAGPPIPPQAVVKEEEIVINDVVGRTLGERYHVLILIGDSPRELAEWDRCEVKVVCSDTGDATVYSGHVLEYRQGHDGMGGDVTTIKILLEDDKECLNSLLNS